MNLLLTLINEGGGIAGIIFSVFYLALIVLIIAGMWKIFVKAGHPGWAAIVPIYNLYILTQIAGRPAWWIVLMLIPLVNIVIAILIWMDVAKGFGKESIYGIGLALLGFIFIPMLGFGDAQFQGPAGPEGQIMNNDAGQVTE